MKKITFAFLASVLLALTSLQADPGSGIQGNAPQVAQTNPVEVYYFHMTRRCMTCQTVEKVAGEAVTEQFKDAVDKGQIVFKSVNIEDKANKALLKKLKVSGQSLLIVKGNEKIDITDKGFLYAVNEPEKLKSEIKTNIQKFMK